MNSLFINLLAVLAIFSTGTSESGKELSHNTGLTIMADHVEAEAGKQICVDVKVADFQNLLSMQYTITWDENVLELDHVQGFKLPFLGARNFGAHRKSEGILTVVWIDNDLQGISVADGTSIYQLCFNVKGQSGNGSEIKFEPEPTPFEVVNIKEQVLSLNPVAGSVVIK